MKKIDTAKKYIKPDFDYWPAERLNSIQAQMSGGGYSGGGSGGVTTTTIELECGKSKTVTINSGGFVYFYCSVNGAFDVSITSTKRIDVDIYKLKAGRLIDKNIYSKDNVTTITETIYKRQQISSGLNEYRVFVDMRNNNYAQITCKISQHVDRKSGVLAAKWEPKDESVQAGANLHFYKYYVDKDTASDLYNLVEESNFLSYASAYVSGTMGIASWAATAGVATGTVATFASLASGSATFATLFSLLDFKQMVKDRFDEAGGFDGLGAYGRRIYRNGICLTSYMSDGLMYFDVESWTNNIAKGAEGEVGVWSNVK